MSDDLSIPNPTYRGPRRGRRGGLDPAMQRLLMYAGGVVGVIVLIGGVSLLFNRHSGPVPVVQADPRPLRVKPDNPGGMQIAGSGEDTADDGKPGKLAPAPEAPDPKALRAQPAPVAPQAAAPAVIAPPPPAARPAVVPAAPPAAKPAQPAATAAVPAGAPPAAAAPPAHAAAAAKPLPAGKAAAVQLAALSSEEAAKTEWQQMAKRMPDLLHGRLPAYSKIERDGRSYWRVRVAGFADLGQARTFCERVRAKGASCSVADF